MVNQQSYLTYRPDIDGLRAVAVLPVVAVHAFPSLIPGGFIGVDIFFVISGYLISSIIFESLDKGVFTFRGFYSRRIKRIFPALFVVLVACLAIGWFVMGASEYRQLGKHIAAGAGFVSNIAFWFEAGYFDSQAATKPLLHLWSLGVEEQFYLLWPVVVWLAWKRKFNILTLLVFLTLVSFSLNIIHVQDDQVAAFYSPMTRFWELLCGGLLAWLSRYKYGGYFLNIDEPGQRKTAYANWLNMEHNGRLAKNSLSFVGMAFLFAGFFLIDEDLRFPGVWALAPVLGTMLVISGGADAWINRALLSSRLIVWIGLISYPLYLWHWPLLIFTRILVGEEPSVEVRILAVTLSVILAWATYKLVEMPMRRSKGDGKQITLLILLMMLLGCVGYSVYQSEGLKTRSINLINHGVEKAFTYDVINGLRINECLITPRDENTSTFADHCVPNRRESQPMLMIWGDSHAASLYSGLSAKSKGYQFDIAQLTSSACPPILGYRSNFRKECSNVNAAVYDTIKDVKPDTLLLGAYWSIYNGSKGLPELDIARLTETIERLKPLGIGSIAIVGHLPSFTVNQAEMLKRRHIWEKVEARSYRNFRPESISYNEKIREVANKTGIAFIDPMELLCDEAGCLISLSEDDAVPLSFDYGHFNAEGSAFFVNKMFSEGLISVKK